MIALIKIEFKITKTFIVKMRSYYQFPIPNPELEIRGGFNGWGFPNLIKYIDDANIKFLPKKVGNNKIGQNEINKEIRSCYELSGSVNLYLRKNTIFKKFAEFLEEPETENLFSINKYYYLISFKHYF